jgi:hypothetical protein
MVNTNKRGPIGNKLSDHPDAVDLISNPTTIYSPQPNNPVIMMSVNSAHLPCNSSSNHTNAAWIPPHPSPPLICFLHRLPAPQRSPPVPPPPPALLPLPPRVTGMMLRHMETSPGQSWLAASCSWGERWNTSQGRISRQLGRQGSDLAEAIGWWLLPAYSR